MNSDFGADIFDEEPARPAPPPPPSSARSESQRSLEVALQTRDVAAPAEPTDDVSFREPPPRTASRRDREARYSKPEEPATASRGSRRPRGERIEAREGDAEARRPRRERSERHRDERPRREPRPWREGERRTRDQERGAEEHPRATAEPAPAAPPEAPPSWQRSDREGREERRRPRREGRESREERRREHHRAPAATDTGVRPAAVLPTTGEAAVATRVAVLLDLHDLEQQARRRGCQVSYGRVLRTLSGERAIVRAVAYTTPSDQSLGASLTAHGIEVMDFANPEAALVAMTLDAMTLATRVDALVIASGQRGLLPLANALRTLGVRVESAALEPTAGWEAQGHIQISRECLFVP